MAADFRVPRIEPVRFDAATCLVAAPDPTGGGRSMSSAMGDSRVIYVGSSRQRTGRWFGMFPRYEPEHEWRQRLATEMDAACQEMSRRGLSLVQVVPVLS